MTKDSALPIYTAYTVVKRSGQDDWWCTIGAAFAHADGNGLNLILQAMPLDGKIVLRPPRIDTENSRESRPIEQDPISRSDNNRSRPSKR